MSKQVSNTPFLLLGGVAVLGVCFLCVSVLLVAGYLVFQPFGTITAPTVIGMETPPVPTPSPSPPLPSPSPPSPSPPPPPPSPPPSPAPTPGREWFQLVNRHSQKCLTAEPGDDHIVQQPCYLYRDSQQWKLPESLYATTYLTPLQSKNGF